MGSPVEKPRDESLIKSVVDVVEAGQRVLVDRLELLSLEARILVRDATATLALLMTGLGLLLAGWVALNVFAVLSLATYWGHARATAVVAAADLVAGAVALALARRRAGRLGARAGAGGESASEGVGA